MKPPTVIKNLLFAASFCILTPRTLSAASAPSATSDEAALKIQLEAREKRADLLLSELRAMDDRIEATVERVIETLRLVGDSKDSRTKVTRLKEETIDGLLRNIAYYQQKRATLQEEMRRPILYLTVEEKQRAIAKFDARIEKRMNQLLGLARSMPTHKDYQQYKVVGGGWYGPTYVENEDYKQNKRLTSHTNTQRAKILKELQSSIDSLDRQSRTLQMQYDAANREAQRTMLREELDKNSTLKGIRRQQLTQTVAAVETPTRPIGGKEARDLDAALRKTVESLRRDFTNLFQHYSTYLVERSHVNAAKAALAVAK